MDLETLQLKFVYAAVYLSLGIIEEYHTRQISKLLEQDKKRLFSDESSVQVCDAAVMDERARGMKFARRFPVLDKAVATFKKELGDGISKKTAIAKWNELTRESPDKWMLRYIRQMGSTCKVLASIAMTIHYRVTYRPDREIKRGEWYYIYRDPQPEYIAQLSSGKCSLVGRDRCGRPVLCIRTALHFPVDQSEEVIKRVAVLALETALYHEKDGCDGLVAIFDMTGMTHANIDYTLISFLIHLVNRVYPRLVGSVLLHNSPKMFQAVWRVIKLWIDPVLADRFRFTSSTNDLSMFVPIDQLPDYLGGFSHRTTWVQPDPPNDSKHWDFKRRHNLSTTRTNIQKEIERMNCRWILGESIAGRASLMRACEHNYWLLAPYLRSETSWDRQDPIEVQRRSSTGSASSQTSQKLLPPIPISPSSTTSIETWEESASSDSERTTSY